MTSRMACIAAGLLVLAVAPVGGATVTFDFASSLQYAQPRQTIAFAGTLTNAGMTAVFINGDSFTFPLPVDDTPFLLGAPVLLLPGQSYIGPVLTVTVPPATPLGLYVGVFNVLGGDTPGQFNALASRDFGVQVVPEPSTWSGILSGVLAVALIRLRTRATAN